MSDSKSFSNKITIGSEKSFGVVFAVFFLIIAAYRFYKYYEISYIFISLTIAFLILAHVFPQIFKIPNIIWFYIGLLLAKIFMPIFLSFIFFILITPMGILVRLYKKNYFDKKIDKKMKSYWINRDKDIGSFSDQF